MSSSGSYASGNSGMSGMNHHTNQMLGRMSSGGYSSGSAQRNIHSSTGTGSQRSLNMRSSSISSGSQSVPEIGYLEEVTEVDNSNTVFIQNHGSAGNNGMQNHGSSGSYGMQNQGKSGSFGMQNNGNSAGSFGIHNNGNSGMLNLRSSGSYGTQNQGSSGSYGTQ